MSMSVNVGKAFKNQKEGQEKAKESGVRGRKSNAQPTKAEERLGG